MTAGISVFRCIESKPMKNISYGMLDEIPLRDTIGWAIDRVFFTREEQDEMIFNNELYKNNENNIPIRSKYWDILIKQQ